MERLVSIGEAAQALGVSITTLRRWGASGKRVTEPTAGGHRCSDPREWRLEIVRAEANAARRTRTYNDPEAAVPSEMNVFVGQATPAVSGQ